MTCSLLNRPRKADVCDLGLTLDAPAEEEQDLEDLAESLDNTCK